MHKSAVVAAFALLAPLALQGVAAAQDAPKKEIIVQIRSDIRSTEPGVNRDAETDTVMHHLVESLVEFQEDLDVAPMLAEKIDISPDQRVYTFTLRPNLVFHNGQPVTSADVKWSWDRWLDPKTNWICRGSFTGGGSAEEERGVKLASIATPDAKTIVFTLEKPSAIFLTLMASVQCPTAIVHKDSVGPDGSWKTPIGTGPFKLAEWKRGEYVLLEKFDKYVPRTDKQDGYAGRREAKVDRVKFLVIADPNAARNAVVAGDIDILPTVPPASIAGLRERGTLQLPEHELVGWTAMLINNADPLLKDVRMRRAIAHAIDRTQIAATATHGRSKPNGSAVPAHTKYHTPLHDEWLPYDPAKSKALLTELGYKGELIKIQTNRRYANMFDNAVVIQSMLHAAGINAQLQVLDWATQLSNYQIGKFQLSAFAFSARPDPYLTYDGIIGKKSVRKTVQWENDEAEKLTQQVGMTTVPAERQRLFDELHKLMMQDVPIVGLYNGNTVTALSPKIKGYRPWGMNSPILWGVTKED
jgi:peptide/nickel transport system substrate-binding protein